MGVFGWVGPHRILADNRLGEYNHTNIVFPETNRFEEKLCGSPLKVRFLKALENFNHDKRAFG